MSQRAGRSASPAEAPGLDELRAAIAQCTPAQRAALRRRAAEERTQRHAAAAEREFLAFVRWTYPGFDEGWVHRELCERLQRVSDDVAARREPRLIVEMPPRIGKTTIVSHRFPVWHMARHPGHDAIATSYAADLAGDNSRKARAIALGVSDRWPQLGKLNGGSWTEMRWEVAGGGAYTAAGVGGPITGRGAHLLLVDDPVKNAQEAENKTTRDRLWAWYESTAESRLAPGGGIVIVTTRWHEDDLVGRVLQRGAETGEVWERVQYPALAVRDEPHRRKGESLHPSRWPREVYEAKRRNSPRWFEALYQCNPHIGEGGTFERGWFDSRYHHAPDMPPVPYEITISIDANNKASAAKSDTAIVVFGRGPSAGNGYDVLDVPTAEPLNYTGLERATIDAVLKWRPHYLLIEEKANGIALIDRLRQELAAACRAAGVRPPIVVAYDPGSTSKEARAGVTSRWWRHGFCRLPRYGTWIAGFIGQHVNFGPGSDKRDLVDATSQYLLWATTGTDGRTAVDRARALAAALDGF